MVYAVITLVSPLRDQAFMAVDELKGRSQWTADFENEIEIFKTRSFSREHDDYPGVRNNRSNVSTVYRRDIWTNSSG